jgi:hypothetical protein
MNIGIPSIPTSPVSQTGSSLKLGPGRRGRRVRAVLPNVPTYQGGALRPTGASPTPAASIPAGRDDWPLRSAAAPSPHSSGRLPHGIYHPKSGLYHLKNIPWYIQNRKMVYIMVYTIDIYHGVYHYYHGMYHDIYHGIYLALYHCIYTGIYHPLFNGIYYDIYHGNHNLTDTYP